MNHDLVVTASIEIAAPPAKVWEVLTNPTLIKEYLFGTNTVTSWEVGSPVTFQGTFGENPPKSYRDKGVVLTCQPGKRLSYSYWTGFSGLADAPENYAIVTYSLEITGGQTVFTWDQRGYPDAKRHQHAQAGMPAIPDWIRYR